MNRRRFLTHTAAVASLATTACSTPAPPGRHAAGITITGLEIFQVRVNDRGNWVIARIQSSAGLTGLGDASHAGNGDPQIAKLQEYFEWIKGRSIYDIEYLRGKAHAEYSQYKRATSCALSAIEQALYDIQAQAAGLPLYQLFGGKLRGEIRNYANINRSTDERTPAGFAKLAESAVAAGFDAIKMASFDGMPRNGSAAEIEAHTQLGIDCIKAVREVIGPDRDLLVDAHSNFDLTRGLDLLKRLEPVSLFWLEEVTRPSGDLAAINEAAPMQTAGGESLFGVKESAEYLAAKPVDIFMPDIKYIGGALELKKVAAMAEGFGVKVSPHGPASPVGNMAAAHVCAGMPNFLILEFSHGEVPWRAELVDPPEALSPGGILAVSERPGLGYTINEKVAAQYKAAS